MTAPSGTSDLGRSLSHNRRLFTLCSSIGTARVCSPMLKKGLKKLSHLFIETDIIALHGYKYMCGRVKKMKELKKGLPNP